MNAPRADRDTERALSTWMHGVAPSQAPTRLLENTFVRTMKTSQAPAWPWHQIGLSGRPFAVPGSSARLAFVALGALIVVALAAALVGGGGPQSSPPGPSPTTTTAAPSPSLPTAVSIRAAATVTVEDPLALVLDGAFLWALAPGRLDQIDPTTNTVTGTAPLGSATDLYNGLAANGAGLWATNSDAALLYRVDPETRKVVAAIPAGSAPKGVLANDAGVWVADVNGGVVLRIDPVTNTVVATTTVGPAGPSGPNWLGSGLGSNWVDVPNNWTIARIDPATDTVLATIPAPDFFVPCGGFGFDPAAVWVTGCAFLFDFQAEIVEASKAMARIDPATNTSVATIALPGYAYSPTMIDGAPWLSIDTGDATTGMLVRIDPATNLIDRVLVPDVAFGGGGDIVLAAGSVWVVDGYNNVVLRLPLAAFGT